MAKRTEPVTTTRPFLDAIPIAKITSDMKARGHSVAKALDIEPGGAISSTMGSNNAAAEVMTIPIACQSASNLLLIGTIIRHKPTIMNARGQNCHHRVPGTSGDTLIETTRNNNMSPTATARRATMGNPSLFD